MRRRSDRGVVVNQTRVGTRRSRCQIRKDSFKSRGAAEGCFQKRGYFEPSPGAETAGGEMLRRVRPRGELERR